MKRSPLSRGGPLARHTPLVAVSGLTRTTGLARRASTRTGPRTPQQERRAAQLEAWVGLRLLVLDRDNNRCVRCGRGDRRLEAHHRRHRSQGGLDTPSNLITLCGLGNDPAYCHGFAHSRANSDAAAVGLSVVWGSEPLEVPVLYSAAHGGGQWLLDDNGTRRRVS